MVALITERPDVLTVEPLGFTGTARESILGGLQNVLVNGILESIKDEVREQIEKWREEEAFDDEPGLERLQGR